MWLLIPVFAAAGAGIWELVRPAPKTEVVIYTPDNKVVGQIDLAMTRGGIDHEVVTDGVNSWILVKPSDRAASAKIALEWTKSVEA